MTGTEYLNRLKDLPTIIGECDQNIREINVSISPAAGFYSYMGSSSGYTDVTGKIAVKLALATDRRDQMVREWLTKYDQASTLIDGMQGRNQRILLTARYVLGLTWNDVAECMGYSMHRCYQIHNEALAEFSRIFETAAGYDQ